MQGKTTEAETKLLTNLYASGVKYCILLYWKAMDIEQSIIQFILKLRAYGGSGALVAYGLFKFLGKKWIEN